MSFGRLSGALLSVCVWGVALAEPSSSASAEPGISRAVEVPPPKGWHPDMPLFAPQPELNGDRGAKPVVKASDRRVAGAQPSGDRLRGDSSKAPSGVKPGTKVGTKARSEAALKTGGKVVRKDVPKDARKPGPPSAKPVTRAPRQATSSSPRQKTSPKKTTPQKGNPKKGNPKKNSRPV